MCAYLLAASAAVGEERVGGVSDKPSPENPWPDAWCFKCDEHLDATGANGRTTTATFADIKPVGHRCYEGIRATNDLTAKTVQRSTNSSGESAAGWAVFRNDA